MDLTDYFFFSQLQHATPSSGNEVCFSGDNSGDTVDLAYAFSHHSVHPRNSPLISSECSKRKSYFMRMGLRHRLVPNSKWSSNSKNTIAFLWEAS